MISGHPTTLVYFMCVCVSMFVSHQISDKRNGFPLAKVGHAVNTVECTSHSEQEKYEPLYIQINIYRNYMFINIYGR